METFKANVYTHENIYNTTKTISNSQSLLPQICSVITKDFPNIFYIKSKKVGLIGENKYVKNKAINLMAGDCGDNTNLYNCSSKYNLTNENKLLNLYETFNDEDDCCLLKNRYQSCLRRPSNDNSENNNYCYEFESHANLDSATDFKNIDTFNLNDRLTFTSQVQDCIIDIDDQLYDEQPEKETCLKEPVKSKALSEKENLLFEIILDLFFEELSIVSTKDFTTGITCIFNEEKGNHIKELLNKLLTELDSSPGIQKVQNPSKCINKYKPKHTDKAVKANDSSKRASFSDIIQMYNDNSESYQDQRKKFQISNSDGCSSQSCYRTKFPSSSTVKSKLDKNQSYINSTVDLPYQHLLNNKDSIKIIALRPFDEILKSHFSPSDRRLISIAKKMNVKIEVFGPIKMVTVAPSFYASRDKIIFHCIIIGQHISDVNKCFKCIRDTFPNSALREI